MASPTRYSCRTFLVSTSNVCCLERHWGCKMAQSPCISSASENDSEVSVILPLSILDISSTSLIKFKRCFDEISILCRQSSTLTLSSILASASFVIPTIAFIGVRISWDILERNILFDAFAFSAAATAALRFSCICCSWVTSVAAKIYFVSPIRFTGRAVIFNHICLSSRSLYMGNTFISLSVRRSVRILENAL